MSGTGLEALGAGVRTSMPKDAQVEALMKQVKLLISENRELRRTQAHVGETDASSDTVLGMRAEVSRLQKMLDVKEKMLQRVSRGRRAIDSNVDWHTVEHKDGSLKDLNVLARKSKDELVEETRMLSKEVDDLRDNAAKAEEKIRSLEATLEHTREQALVAGGGQVEAFRERLKNVEEQVYDFLRKQATARGEAKTVEAAPPAATMDDLLDSLGATVTLLDEGAKAWEKHVEELIKRKVAEAIETAEVSRPVSKEAVADKELLDEGKRKLMEMEVTRRRISVDLRGEKATNVELGRMNEELHKIVSANQELLANTVKQTEDLRQKMVSSDKTIRKAKADNVALKKMVEEEHATLEEALDRCETAEAERRQLQEQCKSLEELMSSLDEEYSESLKEADARHGAQLEEIREQMEAMKEKEHRLNDSLLSKERQLSEFSQRIKDKDLLLKERAEVLNEMSQKLEHVAQEQDTERGQHKTLTLQVLQMEEACRSLTTDKEALEKQLVDYTRLREEVTLLREERDKLENKVEEGKEDQDLVSRARMLHAENKALTSQREEYRVLLDETKTELAAVRRECDRLKDIAKDKNTLEASLRVLRETTTGLQELDARRNATPTASSEELATLRAARQQREEELSELQERLCSLQEKHDALGIQQTEARTLLEKARAQIATLKNEKQHLREELDTKAGLDERATATVQENNALRQKVLELRAISSEQAIRVTQLEEEIDLTRTRSESMPANEKVKQLIEQNRVLREQTREDTRSLREERALVQELIAERNQLRETMQKREEWLQKMRSLGTINKALRVQQEEDRQQLRELRGKLEEAEAEKRKLKSEVDSDKSLLDETYVALASLHEDKALLESSLQQQTGPQYEELQQAYATITRLNNALSEAQAIAREQSDVKTRVNEEYRAALNAVERMRNDLRISERKREELMRALESVARDALVEVERRWATSPDAGLLEPVGQDSSKQELERRRQLEAERERTSVAILERQLQAERERFQDVLEREREERGKERKLREEERETMLRAIRELGEALDQSVKAQQAATEKTLEDTLAKRLGGQTSKAPVAPRATATPPPVSPESVVLGTLHVLLEEGDEMPSLDGSGLVEPYCKLWFGPTQQQSTSISVRETDVPEWQQEFKFPVRNPEAEILRVCCLDRRAEAQGRNALLGESSILINDIADGKAKEVRVGMTGGANAGGRLRLLLEFEPANEKTETTPVPPQQEGARPADPLRALDPKSVFIEGDPRVGNAVFVSLPLGYQEMCTYEWYRVVENAEAVALKGAQGYSYIPTADDVGAFLNCFVKSGGGGGSTIRTKTDERVTVSAELQEVLVEYQKKGATFQMNLSLSGDDLQLIPATLKIDSKHITVKHTADGRTALHERITPRLVVACVEESPVRFVLNAGEALNLLGEVETQEDRDTVVLLLRELVMQARLMAQRGSRSSTLEPVAADSGLYDRTLSTQHMW